MLTAALPEAEGEEPRAAEMPETLADAIVAAGGAGLAGDLYGATAAGPMNAAAPVRDPALLAALGRHLDLQVESAQRLLDLVLRQGAAIRERDAEAVMARLAEIKVEMAARETLERERGALLDQVAVRLGIPPAEVTMPVLTGLSDAVQAAELEGRSAELRGLLAEIAREHGINRALMRQELTFLDHLLRLVGAPPEGGANRLMDVEA